MELSEEEHMNQRKLRKTTAALHTLRELNIASPIPISIKLPTNLQQLRNFTLYIPHLNTPNFSGRARH